MKKKLKILSNEYTIDYNEDVYSVHNAYGLHFGGEQKIYVYSKMPEHKRKVILLHEVIHAIEEMLNLELSEQQVHALSEGICSATNIYFKFEEEKDDEPSSN